MQKNANAPLVRVREVEIFARDAPTRMPFRFGAATIEALSVVYLRTRLEVRGREVAGTGASVSSPMWFDKDPARSYEDKEQALLRSVRVAVGHYLTAPAATAWELHRAIQPRVRADCGDLGIGELASSFGVGLIDSAVVDGLCLRHGASLHAALQDDLLGMGRLAGLPEEPAAELAVRHTVGLADPLADSDVRTRLDDGLPETLEEVIRAYGVRWFKIKIGADTDANLERLRRIAGVLEREAKGDWHVVLDGNESFPDMGAFHAFVRALQDEHRLAALGERLLWFEQPVERGAALDDAVVDALRRVSSFRPVVLDESDATDEVVGRALALGYGGVSAKNCKGVFRTLHSHQALAGHGGTGVLAAEDLTNPAVLPLHQDTAVVAALGLPHAERNGHHYVRGLAHLTAGEQEAALREYPSLYERTPEGLARLRIQNGVIDVRELVRAPYGTRSAPDFDALEPLELPA